MSVPITAVIVDDEALARDAIRLRLEHEPDIRLLGEAANGFEAVKLIEAEKPDVVFLDVKMPELDGFEVIDRVSSVHLPIVVFVTAYDRFAIRAFETHALDYLLKPFTVERFGSALNRARLAVAKAGDDETHQRLIALLDRERPAGPGGPRLAMIPREESPYWFASRCGATSASRWFGSTTWNGSSRAQTTRGFTSRMRRTSSA